MVVLSKKNVIIPSADGSQSVRLSRDQITDVPAWAAKTPYFKALVADGKLCTVEKKKPEKPAKPPEQPPETPSAQNEDQTGGTSTED